MNRCTEKTNYKSSWVEEIETNEYIPLNHSTDTTTGKCIDKLGKLENIFDLIEDMYKKPVYWRCYNGEVHYDFYSEATVLYNPVTNEIEIYGYEFIAKYKVEEYGVSWWTKENCGE